jgi:hypothetical protein
MKSFHLKYGCQLVQTTVPTTARNELQNHDGPLPFALPCNQGGRISVLVGVGDPNLTFSNQE